MAETTAARFEPFRRHDAFGAMGKEGHEAAYWKLVMQGIILVPVRLVCMVALFMSVWVTCHITTLLQNARLQTTACSALARWSMLVLGFTSVRYISYGKAQGKRPIAAGGIVANHVSWVDIPLLMGMYWPAFVAKASTEKVPFVGFIGKCLGCIFVQREGKNRSQGTAAKLKERMQAAAAGSRPDDRPVLVFPEGTTTNGQFLLPFHTGAFLAGQPLQPVVLEYGQGSFSPAWESIAFLRHLLMLMAMPYHSLTVHELPVYVPSEEERQDAVLFRDNVRTFMLQAVKLRDSEATLSDKREYHRQLREAMAAA